MFVVGCVLVALSIAMFVLGWFVPKWAGLEPGPVVFFFCAVAVVLFLSGGSAIDQAATCGGG